MIIFVFLRDVILFSSWYSGFFVFPQRIFVCPGVPKPEVIWCKDGRALRNGYKHKMLEDAGLQMLEIKGIKLDDATTYTCKARNPHGQAVSECKLKVVGESTNHCTDKETKSGSLSEIKRSKDIGRKGRISH